MNSPNPGGVAGPTWIGWRRARPVLKLPEAAADLAQLRKGDARKAVLAAILRAQTTVGFDWIAKRLAMGHPGSVSRLVSQMKRDRKWKERANEMEKMFHCGD